jgi:hypothetical protein
VRQTSLLETTWIEVKDGNDTARDIFSNHYSADERFRDPLRKILRGADLLFIGPGEKLVLITPCARALFGWRREKHRLDGQIGVNCCFFRNEGAGIASDLIRAADAIAWERWPGERLYTFVDPARVRHKRDPGRCFLRAGWIHAGWTKGGHGKNSLRILECFPPIPASPLDTSRDQPTR